VGFAISINRVKKVMEELKSNGKIERKFNPGFRIQSIDERLAKYYKLNSKQGVIVVQILKNGNADQAGLKTEDIILEANGEKIRNEQDLIFIINDLRTGDIVKLKVLRGNSEKEIELKLLSQ
jgi:S1-C subfamily serine protease